MAGYTEALEGLGLPPWTREYRYQGRQQLLKILDREQMLYSADKTGRRSEYVVFSHIDEATFQQFYDSRLHLHSYLPRPQLLIAKMENSVHAIAHGALVAEVIIKLKDLGMSVTQNLKVLAGGTIKGPDRSKTPDHQFFPKPLPESRDSKWPSMVIEVEQTETALQLRRDAAWWTNASDGDVKLVLTIHVPKKKRIVTYCLWHPRDRPARPNKQITAQLRHQVTVVRRADLSIIASDNLTIPFGHLFLRNPQGSETDIVIDKDTLQRLAEDTWEEMKKSERECKCLCLTTWVVSMPRTCTDLLQMFRRLRANDWQGHSRSLTTTYY